jgi:hypothetical protein
MRDAFGKARLAIGLCCALGLAGSTALARDWYVSEKRGSGKQGTQEAPAKDLGNITSQLQAGDVVHIAEGTYLGKGESGVDELTLPVSILGGYADDFSTRDPWGAHRTILSGDNKTKNWKQGARLEFDLSKYREKTAAPITVDGLIVDQGAQNRYKDDKGLLLLRKADPKSGANPTPDRGGIFIRVTESPDPKGWRILVRNNIVLNSAPTQGALAVFAYANDQVIIANNAVINCTGTGIYAGTSWHGSDQAKAPRFKVINNTVLFTWKYDAYVQSFSGVNFATDDSVVAELYNNILGFADRFAVQKIGKWPLTLKSNILVGAVDADYYESVTDMKIPLAKLADEAETLSPESGGNGNNKFEVPLSQAWREAYGTRVLVDRNAVEADIQAQRTRANFVRGVLGLPQRADDVKADSDVWLHRLPLEDAVKVASTHLTGKFGSSLELIKEAK